MSDMGPQDPMEPENPKPSSSCSICLELVLDHRERAIAKLHCGHDFHLDCIGSAFNVKGAMQCPNCRKVEKGRWLYANGHRSSSGFYLDGWVPEDIDDLSFPELPFGFQWCPFRGFTQLASLFEDGESELNPYYESLGNATFGDHSSSSSSSHVCPYIPHGFPHHMHAAAPSSSVNSVPENNPFPSAELSNHAWQQQHSLPFSFLGNGADHLATQFAPRLSRSDTSSQQGLGSFVHPHHLGHGSVPWTGSNLVASLAPPVAGDVRGHHMYQQSMPSSAPRSSPFPPTGRLIPGGVALVSSLSAPAASSPEVGGFYSFASANGRSHQEAGNVASHFDRFYGWRHRESFMSHPWIPLEGESQWWGPFNPDQALQSGGSFVPRPANAERAAQQMFPGPRMPPPSYM